ncbi:MAG: hypothetical protein K9N49_01740, partial [Candidatus Marinimicrobia bacterium]|nr:hypothetical protein [Candidatus Neomarinimicrobiota bacterium]
IPADWPGFRVRRRYRGGCYDVTMDNSAGVNGGVAALWMDGCPVPPDEPLPLPRPGRVHEVRARLGQSAKIA